MLLKGRFDYSSFYFPLPPKNLQNDCKPDTKLEYIFTELYYFGNVQIIKSIWGGDGLLSVSGLENGFAFFESGCTKRRQGDFYLAYYSSAAVPCHMWKKPRKGFECLLRIKSHLEVFPLLKHFTWNAKMHSLEGRNCQAACSR